jgi:hypothetical protein
MSVHKIVNIYKFLPVNVVKYKIIDVGDFKRRRETAVATMFIPFWSVLGQSDSIIRMIQFTLIQ